MHFSRKYPNQISLILISFFLILFYGLIFYETTLQFSKYLFSAGFILLFLGLISQKSKIKKGKYKFFKKISILSLTPLAAVMTFTLSTKFGFGPVIASSFVGLIYSSITCKIGKFWHKLSGPVYCGSFVGMGSLFVFTDIWMIGLAGLGAGILLITAHYVYRGIGGMLGTKAFISSTIVKTILIILGG